MIILQFVLAQSAEYAQHSGSRVAQLGLLANHKSVGMTILALAVLRLGWRLAVRPPRLPAHMPGWQVTVSHLTHWLLYGFLFALPLTGWLMSSAASYSVSWFGLFTWPDLVAPDTGLRDSMKFIHDLLGKGLFVITVLHILAACKHHFLDRDDVLRRMTSAMPLLVGGVILAGGTYALTDVGAPASSRAVGSRRADTSPCRDDGRRHAASQRNTHPNGRRRVVSNRNTRRHRRGHVVCRRRPLRNRRSDLADRPRREQHPLHGGTGRCGLHRHLD